MPAKRGRPPTLVFPGQPSPDRNWLVIGPDPDRPRQRVLATCAKCGARKSCGRSSLTQSVRVRCWSCEPRGSRPHSGGRVIRILSLCREGRLSYSEIARMEGITKQYVSKIVRQNGLAERSRGRPKSQLSN